MIGLHILSDLKGVDFSKINIDEKILKNLISKLLKQNKLTELGSYYHTFNKKQEITCVVALAESHISLHLWPEKKYISLDIFVCNLGEDNSQKAKKIYQDLIVFFKPKNLEENFIERKNS